MDEGGTKCGTCFTCAGVVGDKRAEFRIWNVSLWHDKQPASKMDGGSAMIRIS